MASSPSSCSFLVCLSLVFAIIASSCRDVHGRWLPPEEENEELEAQLKKLNKPAVRTIQSKINGALFDCIDIYKQPAFDHPLLKDHKLQLRPTRLPQTLLKSSPRAKLGAIDWGYNDSCPTGTVLIRRATREDLIASKRIPGRYSRMYDTEADGGNGKEATYRAMLHAGNSDFTGFHASLTTWEIPSVGKEDQCSASSAWIGGVPGATANGVEAGWHVYPAMYSNDYRPHFFTRWTRNNFWSSGCFNLECSGFVQVSSNFAPGSVVPDISHSIADEKHINIDIFKDAQGWWLFFNGLRIGYWPNRIFSDLSVGKVIDFGGVVYTPSSNIRSLPMGNGNFPGLGSAYFRNVQFSNGDGQIYTPDNKDLSFDVTLPDYYKIWKDSAIDANFNVAYGGPGGYVSG